MSAALAGVTVASLLFDGASLRSDVVKACTAADVTQAIDGADTLTVGLRDPHRTLLRSGIFSKRLTCQVDAGHAFELVGVRKLGSGLVVVFEDLAVAALRRRNKPRKIGPGKQTRVQFARTLVAEEKWIKFVAPVPGARTKIELARGKVATAQDPAELEDTWDATGRLSDEVQWRRYSNRGAIYFLPESWLFGRPSAYRLTEGKDGCESINFDFDIGKPIANVKASVYASRWQVSVGTAVDVVGQGPATGKWLVSAIDRSLFSPLCDVTLVKPLPSLPEPAAPPPTSSPGTGGSRDASDGVGKSVDTGNASTRGFVWPVRGTVRSPYGPRGGRLHAGIDIAVPVGTPVGSTAAGTVIFAGEAGGYGSVVYVNHNGTTSRYAHLSSIEARRGQTVERGERIGLSGGAAGAPGAGNSSGPHLHFEIRPGDRPANPLDYL